MRVTRLVLPLAATALVVPLVLSAAAKSNAPTFQQYTSPVGVSMVTGDLPQPAADAYQAIKDKKVPGVYGIWVQHGLGDDCGEPTLAVDKRTGAVLYQCGLQTLLVNGFGKGGKSTWTPTQSRLTGEYTADPILYQDRDTGRVFVNQLGNPNCSYQAYSDDFGTTWTQSAVGCAVGISFDHQTVGTGRPTALKTTPLYKNVVYYCTNDVILDCGVSLDGGLTYGPNHPVSTDPGESCSPIVGHIKSAPDGTTYLMPDGCTDEAGKQAVFVTTDNALTWTKHNIPGSTEGDAGHPSLAVASDGTVYASWGSKDNANGGGRVYVSVSRDRGAHWTVPMPMGKRQGVKVSRFPLAVAGDGDRAAVAYLGSTSGDNPSSNKDFQGTWRMYVSYTFDRGWTWTTYDATPASPVQVGDICTGGQNCIRGPYGDRNLLDFNDMVLDSHGRVVIAFADGCLKTKGCTTRDRLKKGAIVKQTAGPGLFRAYG